MRRLKKRIYLGLWSCVLGGLFIARLAGVGGDAFRLFPDSGKTATDGIVSALPDMHAGSDAPEYTAFPVDSLSRPRPIRSVPSYRTAFPDLQEVQIVAAQKWGVSPVADRAEAESRKAELVYVGASPYYDVDKAMSHSIPYLVPRASCLLQRVGRNFLDSLYVKGVPLHKVIVSSVLRTDDDVRRLKSRNPNASEQSCHRYGTTFDVCYNRYTTVSHPDGPERRAVQSDTLKWVLSEVLRDLRERELCYIKYEVNQGCFHITVR